MVGRKSWLLMLGLVAGTTWAGLAAAADPVARDIGPSAGLKPNGSANVSTQGETPVFDYDKDGDPDLLLSTHGGSPWPLMRNNGDGTFTQVMTFPKTDRHGCVAVDIGSTVGNGKQDGLPDIYCVTGACEGNCKKEYPNHLYLQKPDHTFVEAGKAWGVADPHGRGRVPLVLDYDRDGKKDIVVVNEGPSIFPSPSRMFRNVRGKFREIADPAINQETWAICGKVVDFDNDGWKDIVLCTDKTAALRMTTYRNNRGRFQDITASTSYKGLRTREFDFADMNGDKKPDLLIVEEKRFSVWLNVNGRYPEMSYSRSLKLGRDLAVGDVNLDGKLDVYIGEGKNSAYPDILLINNGNGKSFHVNAHPLPRVTKGDTDVVTAIPNWRGTKRAAFLVSNGKWGASGPYQLIVFSDR
ncbi:MAG: FG-GAP repeat domain-containing protein [Geminicoccaceae bacterium]